MGCHNISRSFLAAFHQLCFWIVVSAICFCTSVSADTSLPSTQDFNGALTTCATGSAVDISADLLGSVASFYSGQRSNGAASFRTATNFLELFPEDDRAKVYELYTKCISQILHVRAWNAEQCDGMPGETAWIYAGQYEADTGRFVQGPFAVAELEKVPVQNITEGSWIKLTVSRKTMIIDYSTRGVERALDSPFRLDGKVSYTCKIFPVGQRLYVAAKEINGPSAEVRHVWFRVRLAPPGG
jgi:hypothetical protein